MSSLLGISCLKSPSLWRYRGSWLRPLGLSLVKYRSKYDLQNERDFVMKNWKTTAAGLLSGLALCLTQVGYLLDADPATNPDFSVIIAAIGLIVHGFVAKDSTVTGVGNN